MGNKLNKKASTWTYEQCNGENFTTSGVDLGTNVGNGTAGVYAGVGTSFTEGSTGAVIDLKGSMPYGKTCVSAGFRLRNTLNENSKTIQFRIQPCTVTVPISNKTSIYTTPYAAVKVDYKTGDTKTTFGNYTGVQAKIGKNTTVYAEGQLYDFTKVKSSTVSFNIGAAVNF